MNIMEGKIAIRSVKQTAKILENYQLVYLKKVKKNLLPAFTLH